MSLICSLIGHKKFLFDCNIIRNSPGRTIVCKRCLIVLMEIEFKEQEVHEEGEM